MTYFLLGEEGKGKEFDKFVLLKGNVEIKNATSKTEAFFIMPGEDVKIGAEVREKGSKTKSGAKSSPAPGPAPTPSPGPQEEKTVTIAIGKITRVKKYNYYTEKKQFYI